MKTPDTKNFNVISLALASPDKIKEWSYGEVTKAETINYRTGRSERGGLFDERIFGPERDFECYCGKYRRIRYKNIVCEKCGVEVTRSIVRRERMGHIELAAPVSHIWFLRGVPSRIGLLLGSPLADVEKVIYFAGYIVTDVNQEEKLRILKDIDSEFKMKVKSAKDEAEQDKLKERLITAKREIEDLRAGLVFDEITYHKYSLKYGTAFTAEIGAEAIYRICKSMDLSMIIKELEASLEKAAAVEREKIQKRLGLLKNMLTAGVRPEWMFLTVIPVMPPGLRPMVALEGGRHATSDVNDLYRRVINRNNRLRKLLEIGAPDVILRNEKRILQEAVDSLIDNSIRHGQSQALAQTQKRQLKSLSDNLKGKQGLFRQNLLGKRVDYSGRSVIVVGPDLKLNQCGLPKHMALELFRPFVINKILERELAYNIRGAGRLIEEGVAEVWAILEEVIKGKFVLLNRAPTLHRLGIQAFNPVLIEGNAIELHPMVCSAFNADFDGDQMAVHVPLGTKAQEEAREIMAASKNLLKPGNGDPVASAKLLDIVLGCYWVTKQVEGARGEGKFFSSPNEAITAYDFGAVDLRAKIRVMGTDSPKYGFFEGKPFETTVGRLLFNSVLPKDYAFINNEIDNKALRGIVDNLLARYPLEEVPPILDKVKAFGFRMTTRSGITWSINDLKIPEGKKSLVESGLKQTEAISQQYSEGLLSESEQSRLAIEVWSKVKSDIEKLLPDAMDKLGPVYDMWKSGARGSLGQITQMAGMKGLITNTVGKTLDFPVINSYKEGLSPIAYFITTHGSRKGLTDTALQTAKAGYLTRRLVDVAQDVIITDDDCGDKSGKRISMKEDAAGIGIALSKVIGGRMLAKDAQDENGATIIARGTMIGKDEIAKLEAANVEEVYVRSPLICKNTHGLCQKCYGMDLGRHKLVNRGEAVGIVAAQAIGEPGTQLTMRTFHQGGVAGGADITMGLPRVEEIFERRMPKNPAVVSKVEGDVIDIKRVDKEQVIVILPDVGTTKKKEAIEYPVAFGRTPLVSVGSKVKKGMRLTDGSADIGEIFKYGGKEAAENYVISEISRVYDLQGASISRKHIEVIVRQMFSRRKIKSLGDTKLVMGDIVEEHELVEENDRVRALGGEEGKGDIVVLGITEVSLTTKSFLSAASFQNTTRVLINAAIAGVDDELRGLKENVIIGRLIPAGTGFENPEADVQVSVGEDASAAYAMERGA